MEQLLGQVFAEAMQNRFVYPISSEVLFFALRYFQYEGMAAIGVAAWLGACSGSVLNYGLGVAFSSLQKSGLSSIPQDKYALWGRRSLYALPVIALLGWVHLTGVLLVAMGFLNTRWVWVVPAIFCGQGIYYLYHTLATFAVM